LVIQHRIVNLLLTCVDVRTRRSTRVVRPELHQEFSEIGGVSAFDTPPR